jgi:multiple sugar transport system permease protein
LTPKHPSAAKSGPVVSTGPTGLAMQNGQGQFLGKPLDRSRVRPVSFVLLAPATVLMVALFMGPLLFAIYLGFTNLQLIGIHAVKYRFTGLSNLTFMLGDEVFYKSIWLTVVFVIGSGAIGTTLLGLTLALAVQGCSALFRWLATTAAILAWTLPPTTIAFLWMATSTHSGLISVLAMNKNMDILYDQAMLIVCVANAWSLAGLAMTMFSAALRNIPSDLYEAARLEGANSAQNLMRITLPLLKPTIVTCGLLMTLMTFGNFTLIYLMTGGGPAGATNILPVYTYLQGFKFYNLGYAALLGNVMVLLSALMGGLLLALSKSRRKKAS